MADRPYVTGEKYQVTMKKTIVRQTPAGSMKMEQKAVDYVPEDWPIEAYVRDAETRWDSVEVSSEPDWGPGGKE